MTNLSFLSVLGMGLLAFSVNPAPAIAQSVVDTRPEKIGDFNIVHLDGWTRKKSYQKGTDVVFYYKTAGTSQITLTFSWEKGIDDGERRITRYRSLIKTGESMFSPAYHRSGAGYKVVSENLLTLNGIPAVMHKTSTSGGGRTDLGETIQFAHNNKFYVLTRGITFTAPKASPQLQATLDQGWTMLSKGIKAKVTLLESSFNPKPHTRRTFSATYQKHGQSDTSWRG